MAGTGGLRLTLNPVQQPPAQRAKIGHSTRGAQPPSQALPSRRVGVTAGGGHVSTVPELEQTRPGLLHRDGITRVRARSDARTSRRDAGHGSHRARRGMYDGKCQVSDALGRSKLFLRARGARGEVRAPFTRIKHGLLRRQDSLDVHYSASTRSEAIRPLALHRKLESRRREGMSNCSRSQQPSKRVRPFRKTRYKWAPVTHERFS